MIPVSTSDPPKVTLKPRRALPFFSRHPWVFEGAIDSVQGTPNAGDEVALLSHEGQFIAWGLWNPHSQIRARLYSWKDTQRIDRELFSRRLDAAIELRRRLFSGDVTQAAQRLVFSEGDELSGLVIDRYGDWLLLQITSLAIAQRVELLVELLREKLAPRGVIVRTERGMAEQEQLELTDGVIWGEAPPAPLFIVDSGLRFGLDVLQGQKTGFYLDQRDNRAAAARYLTPQARVLDAFCYSGGFGLAAAIQGGAREVVAVDTSEPALLLARQNAELNGVGERFRWIQADVFDHLEQLASEGKPFDAICLDPPKLARTRKGLDRAMKGYFSLNHRALELLVPGGLLVTCSCSGLVSRTVFEEMLSRAALKADRHLQILEIRGQAADHPISPWCPETEYLKCFICRAV